MIYLKKFHLFEKIFGLKPEDDEAKYNYNEKYFELVDILQSKIFDEYDIIKGTDEMSSLFTQKHKFWLFSVNTYGLISFENLGSKVIKSLSIFNIPDSEHLNLYKDLQSLEALVEDYTGMKLVILSMVCPGVCNTLFFAFKLRLQN